MLVHRYILIRLRIFHFRHIHWTESEGGVLQAFESAPTRPGNQTPAGGF